MRYLGTEPPERQSVHPERSLPRLLVKLMRRQGRGICQLQCSILGKLRQQSQHPNVNHRLVCWGGCTHLEGQWQHASPAGHINFFLSGLFLSIPRGRAHLFLLKAWGGLLEGLYPALLVRLRSTAGVTTSELSLCSLCPVICPTRQRGGF